MAPLNNFLRRTVAFVFATCLALVMLSGLPWSGISLLPQETFPTGETTTPVPPAPAFTAGAASRYNGEPDRPSQITAVLEQAPAYPQAMAPNTAQRLSWEVATDNPVAQPPTEEELRLASLHANYTDFFRRFRKHTGEPTPAFAQSPATESVDASNDPGSMDAEVPLCATRRVRARVRNVAAISQHP